MYVMQLKFDKKNILKGICQKNLDTLSAELGSIKAIDYPLL